MAKLTVCLFVLCVLSPTLVNGQEYRLTKVETNSPASFRGLSVVDDRVAWVSGSKGWVGRTTNAGKDWTFSQVTGFESADFRSLYAFDSARAIIANVGSPAYILLTTDAGKTWVTVYANTHKDAFFDGINFWNLNPDSHRDGLIYGDPIDGKMLLLRTTDGGRTWKEVAGAPMLAAGEASFAASGTGIRCTNNRDVTICTGGVVSRLWVSKDQGESWSSLSVPMVQGKPTTGILSFIENNKVLTIVGGDFQDATLAVNIHFYSLDGGKQWLTPATSIRAYRECIEAISTTTLIATGPSGTDISNDYGLHWKTLSDEKGLHVIRKAQRGNLVIAAGGNGSVFLLR